VSVDIWVQKYGGSSVADVEKIRKVAARVKARQEKGQALVVVVSAMGDTTDELLTLARRVSPDPPRRELDMLLTCGERISMALLSMALHELGVPAVSFTGSQSGIITDEQHSQARIVEVRPNRIREALAAGKVAIVAGYQGVSRSREVTTLGRGGSDTTAVALAAALSAQACEIYSDVDGVFTADPRIVKDARQLEALSYEEMQALASSGAQVLNAQAVEFAREKGIEIHALSTHSPGNGTRVGASAAASSSGVVAVACERQVGALEWRGRLPEGLLSLLEGAGARPRWIAGEVVGDGRIIFALQDVHGFDLLAVALREKLGEQVQLRTDLGTVTLVGAGMLRDTRRVAQSLAMCSALKILCVSTHASALELSLLVPSSGVPRLTETLHAELIRPG
jgi:aspartate kinase